MKENDRYFFTFYTIQVKKNYRSVDTNFQINLQLELEK